MQYYRLHNQQWVEIWLKCEVRKGTVTEGFLLWCKSLANYVWGPDYNRHGLAHLHPSREMDWGREIFRSGLLKVQASIHHARSWPSEKTSLMSTLYDILSLLHENSPAHAQYWTAQVSLLSLFSSTDSSRLSVHKLHPQQQRSHNLYLA